MARRHRRNQAVGCRSADDSGGRVRAVDNGRDHRCGVALSGRRRNQRPLGGRCPRIPDEELNVIVDLAQQNNEWVGSIIIPGLGVKGTPLRDIKVQPPEVNFAVKDDRVTASHVYAPVRVCP